MLDVELEAGAADVGAVDPVGAQAEPLRGEQRSHRTAGHGQAVDVGGGEAGIGEGLGGDALLERRAVVGQGAGRIGGVGDADDRGRSPQR